MWSVPSGCIGIHAVKIYQARLRQFFGGVCCHFYLSAAVIALNAFWRCVQLRDYGKFDNVADVDA